MASIAPASRVEVQHVDYDVHTVQALAESFARAAAPGVPAAFPVLPASAGRDRERRSR